MRDFNALRSSSSVPMPQAVTRLRESAAPQRSWGGGGGGGGWNSGSVSKDMPAAFGSGGGWTGGASGPREMPSAFGGGDRDNKRAEAKAAADREAAAAWAKKQADIKEEKRRADVSNFASEESYPSLGAAKLVAKAPPPLNFKKTVEEMASRVAAQEEQQARRDAAVSPVKKVQQRQSQARSSIYRNTDDGPEDYDGPEEGEEDDGEFNADMYSTRRRGDKGIW